MSESITPYGLTWETNEVWGNIEPAWAVELDTTCIAAAVSAELGTPVDTSQIDFVAEGVYNKLYKVRTEAAVYAMRIALPIDIPHKVKNEVDTMSFLSRATSIPVPRIFAYDATNHNPLRFPYILMDFVEGGSITDVWTTLSPTQKQNFVVQLAQEQAEVFRHQFDSIGGLGSVISRTETPVFAAIATLVILSLFIAPRLLLLALIAWAMHQASAPRHRSGFRPSSISWGSPHLLDGLTPRGPFRNSHDWLRARLEACLIRHASDPSILAMTRRLLSQLPQLFPESAVDMCILAHQDMHEGNILIDVDCTPTAILDWEFTSVLPAWYACQIPGVCITQDIPRPDIDYHAYHYDMYQYEMYHTYRQLFEETMGRLQPRWLELSRSCKLEMDFEEKVDVLEQGCPQDEGHQEDWDEFENELKERGAMYHLWSV